MNSERPTSEFLRAPLSRRSALRLFAVAGAGVAGMNLLAGCAPTTATGPAGRKPVAGGTLRIGINGGNSGTVLDPHVLNDAFNSFVAPMFYEPLTWFDNDFAFQSVLADEFTPNADATQWTMRVKDGVEFHNGKTLGADDVIFSYRRILDPSIGAIGFGNFSGIADMTKLDARTVRFTLKSANGSFNQLVGDGGAFGIIPTDFDVTKPVSTGPWKFDSHQPGVSAQFSRFENYYGPKALLDTVVLSVLGDDDARVNALLSKQVDAVSSLPAAQFNRVKADSSLALIDAESGYFGVITMRVDDGATADVRVRQALRLCLDRQQVLEVLYGGHGVVASDLYGRYDPAYDASLTRKQDVAKAKSLVKAAGATGKNITITTYAQFQGMCQILAQNAKEIGLNVSVDLKDDATYYNNYPNWPIGVDSYPATTILSTAAMSDGPNAFLNQTHFSDPEYDALFNKATAAMTEKERKPYLTAMQKILFEKGGYIIPVFYNTLAASSAATAGWLTKDATGLGLPRGMAKVGFTSASK